MQNKFLRCLFGVFLISTSIMFYSGCNSDKSQAPDLKNKLNVAVTIYPICNFVQKVGGDKVDVVQLIPAGAEPHDWEPKPQDINKLKNSKAFFYNGVGLEPVDNILTSDVINGVKVVDLSKGITLILANDSNNNEHGHDSSVNHDKHETHLYDPHIWLDPQNAVKEVEAIRDTLCLLDKDNEVYYKKNAENYIGELQRLDAEYQEKLQKAKKKTFVTSHDAFAYLAKRYSLTQLAVMGLSPEEEPTAEHIKIIVEICKKNDIKYIFTETMVSPKLSETIAKEVGAKTLTLNPIESLTETEIRDGDDYIKVMRKNLENLIIALN